MSSPVAADWVDAMNVYFLLLGAGRLVGVMYNLFNVRSPAPPLAALVGLFGSCSASKPFLAANICSTAGGSPPRSPCELQSHPRHAAWPSRPGR